PKASAAMKTFPPILMPRSSSSPPASTPASTKNPTRNGSWSATPNFAPKNSSNSTSNSTSGKNTSPPSPAKPNEFPLASSNPPHKIMIMKRVWLMTVAATVLALGAMAQDSDNKKDNTEKKDSAPVAEKTPIKKDVDFEGKD